MYFKGCGLFQVAQANSLERARISARISYIRADTLRISLKSGGPIFRPLCAIIYLIGFESGKSPLRIFTN
jgi:hypothetical protein